MARLGPTQIVIREKLEIRMQNGFFQGKKNGKHLLVPLTSNTFSYTFLSGITYNM